MGQVYVCQRLTWPAAQRKFRRDMGNRTHLGLDRLPITSYTSCYDSQRDEILVLHQFGRRERAQRVDQRF